MLPPSLLILASLLFLLGCTKEQETPEVIDNCQLKTITIGDQPGVRFTPKMELGRIVQLTSATDTQTKKVYIFNSKNQFVKREDFTNDDNLGATLVRTRWEHNYDSSNHVLATIQYNQSYSGGVALGLSVGSIDSFRYTAGLVSEVKTYAPFNATNIYQGKTLFSWANGDVASLLQYGPNGQLIHSVYFTYDATKENRYDSLFTGFYIQELFEAGHALEGLRRSKHVLVGATEQWTGSSPVNKTYTTTYNASGLIKSVLENAYGLTYYIYRFGYTCD